MVEREAVPRWPEPTRTYIAVGGHRIHYRAITDLAPPQRTPVVLVHGQIVSGEYLEPTLRRLATHVPALAPDLPGYGKSSDPEHFLGTEALADVLVAFIDALRLERVTLFGNSFGCGIAAAAAMRHPRRVERLVLQGPTLFTGGRSSLRSLWRGLRTLRGEAPRFWRIMWKDTNRAGYLRALKTWQLAIRDPIERRLPHVHMPALVVRGSEDPLVPADWAEHVADLLPRGHLVVVPGAGHIMVLHQSESLVRVTMPFLAPAGRLRAKP
jgi:2-hydroxy-6-oxonona-2,4-dienedioate hydrolase